MTKHKKAYRAIFNSAPDGMILVNTHGDIIMANNQIKHLFGYTNEEILDQKIELLIPNQYKKNHSDLRKSYAVKPKIREMGAGRELAAMRKDGTEFNVEISLSPININEEKFVLATIRDVSEKILINKKLKESLVTIEAKNTELEEFSYIASHDLKAPLTNLKALLKLIDSEFFINKEYHDIFKNIRSTVDVMHAKLNTLNEIIALKSNSPEDEKSLSFIEVFKQVKKEMSQLIIESDMELKVDFSECPKIKYTTLQLHSIFHNLISNAIKYRHPDRTLIVEIKACIEKKKTLLVIKDNGLGFDQSLGKDKIFGLFKRMHTHVEGLGAGLYVVSSIVRSHGGSIEVESIPEAGTTFKLYLS